MGERAHAGGSRSTARYHKNPVFAGFSKGAGSCGSGQLRAVRPTLTGAPFYGLAGSTGSVSP